MTEMKWMFIVIVFGLSPVKSDLVFDSLQECLQAEENIRSEYARNYNAWLEWAKQNPSTSNYPESDPFIRKRGGLDSPGTCIPHAALSGNSN
jgi:hypothetical protein